MDALKREKKKFFFYNDMAQILSDICDIYPKRQIFIIK